MTGLLAIILTLIVIGIPAAAFVAVMFAPIAKEFRWFE